MSDGPSAAITFSVSQFWFRGGLQKPVANFNHGNEGDGVSTVLLDTGRSYRSLKGDSIGYGQL